MANNYTDTNVSNMIFNILSSAKYQELLTGNLLENNQLYFVTDDNNKTLTFTKSGSTIATYNGTTNVTIDLTLADQARKDNLDQPIVSTYIKNLSISGHTLTATRGDDTTFPLTLPDNDTKNTAGSTQSTSKLYLIGATSQAANPQTYSSSKVYVTNDTVTAPNFAGNATSADTAIKATKDAADQEIHKTYIKNASFSNNVLTLTKGNDTTFTTTLSSFPEAYLTWGGQNHIGSYGPIDAAMIDVLGANRLAFLKPDGLTVEYSTNGGSSWSDYGLTDSQKQAIFGPGGSAYLGKHTANGTSTVNDQLRITIATSAAHIYTVLNKFAIYMSTAGNTVQVKIEKALESTPTSYSTVLDWTSITGWSGWNIYNVGGITTYGNTASSQYGRIRFTFRQTAATSTYCAATIYRIMGFGGVGWTVPSNMAKDGHLYSYDSNQNATFPAQVTATQFNGTATKAIGDGSGNTILSYYVHRIEATTNALQFKYYMGDDSEGGIITLKSPIPTNNVTGSGTSGYLAKWNGNNTITNGPALGNDTTTFLNNKGEWVVPTGTYTLPVATYNTLGGVKPAYNWTNSATFDTPTSVSGTAPTVNGRQATAGRYYAVESDKDGRLFVNIPWVNTVTNYSGGNGTAPSWVFENVPCDDITSWSAGSGSYTQGSFSGGSLTISQDSSDTKKFNIVFTAATHGADSHSHTAPTLAYTGKTASHVKSGGNGTASTWSFSKS